MVELPLPRQVPGFEAALAAGLTPARPARPPVVRRPTAHQALVRVGVTMAVAVAVSLPCAFFPPLEDRLGAASVPVFLVMLTLGFFVTRAALIRFRLVLLDELRAGYVTTTFVQGLFWGSGRGDSDVISWEWRGLWTLKSDGRVVSAPDLSGDPPGVYPSPNAPGRRELWTGCRWTNVFFDSGHR